jgi:predicted nucleotidyltransferase
VAIDPVVHRLDSRERTAVVEAIRQTLDDEPDLAFAYLFGSFEEAGPFHDIDVGIFLDGAQPPGTADRRAFDLAGRLEAVVPFPVDVVALNARPVTFRFHVYSGEPLVVNDEDRLAQELERTMAEYFDIEPVLRRATREAFGE